MGTLAHLLLLLVVGRIGMDYPLHHDVRMDFVVDQHEGRLDHRHCHISVAMLHHQSLFDAAVQEDVPGSVRTSYASLRDCIFSSEPPTSG
jgi:hypothetical protein